MTKSYNESEINIKCVFMHVLVHWRAFFVWMIVGAVLFGGYSYYNSAKLIESQKIQYEQQKDKETLYAEFQHTLTEKQLNNVNRVLQYETVYDYYNQSVLMKINPSEVPTVKLMYMIKSDSAENSKSICNVYEEILIEEFLQWCEKNTTITELGGLNELLTVNKGVKNISDKTAVSFDKEDSLLGIEIIHFSEEKCKELASCLKKYMELCMTLQGESLPEHELVYISESFGIMINRKLLLEQQTILNLITEATKTEDTMKGNFSTPEQNYYDFLSEDGEVNAKVLTTNIQIPRVNVKHVVLGMMVFAFIYICIIAVYYMLNTKIRITDDIESIFSITQLGLITKSAEKKGIFWKVDSLVDNIQKKNKRVFTKEEELGLAISAIKIVAKKDGFSNILCMGTAWSKEICEMAEKIKMTLSIDGINIHLVQNVLYNQESLGLLEGATAAFLLETASVVSYDEVAKEIELLKRQEIECLGIVVVER